MGAMSGGETDDDHDGRGQHRYRAPSANERCDGSHGPAYFAALWCMPTLPPPSSTRSMPLTNPLAFEDARKTTAAATSSIEPNRPTGGGVKAAVKSVSPPADAIIVRSSDGSASITMSWFPAAGHTA